MLCSEPSDFIRHDLFIKKRANHILIWEQPLEKLFCHDLYSRIMIRPHGAVLPIRMGIVEILAELSKAVCLLKKHITKLTSYVLYLEYRF